MMFFKSTCLLATGAVGLTTSDKNKSSALQKGLKVAVGAAAVSGAHAFGDMCECETDSPGDYDIDYAYNAETGPTDCCSTLGRVTFELNTDGNYYDDNSITWRDYFPYADTAGDVLIDCGDTTEGSVPITTIDLAGMGYLVGELLISNCPNLETLNIPSLTRTAYLYQCNTPLDADIFDYGRNGATTSQALFNYLNEEPCSIDLPCDYINWNMPGGFVHIGEYDGQPATCAFLDGQEGGTSGLFRECYSMPYPTGPYECTEEFRDETR